MIFLYIAVGFAIGYFASRCQHEVEQDRMEKMVEFTESFCRQFKRNYVEELIRRNGGERK